MENMEWDLTWQLWNTYQTGKMGVSMSSTYTQRKQLIGLKRAIYNITYPQRVNVQGELPTSQSHDIIMKSDETFPFTDWIEFKLTCKGKMWGVEPCSWGPGPTVGHVATCPCIRMTDWFEDACTAYTWASSTADDHTNLWHLRWGQDHGWGQECSPTPQ